MGESDQQTRGGSQGLRLLQQLHRLALNLHGVGAGRWQTDGTGGGGGGGGGGGISHLSSCLTGEEGGDGVEQSSHTNQSFQH